MSGEAVDIDAIVARVLERMQPAAAGSATPHAAPIRSAGRSGIFPDIEQAIRAAEEAYRNLDATSLETRKKMVEAARKAACDAATSLAEDAVRETGMGRVDDKIKKNLLVATKTPGPEILVPEAVTGDHGLSIVDHAPFGVIGSIVPTTNPTETIINNGISMVSAGNTVVFNAHPNAKRCTNRCIALLNDAMHAAGGPPFVFTAVEDPTIETAKAIMAHPAVRLLTVTGGAGVVRAAMQSGKRVVGAGPGNPPAVVDETADFQQAGRDIVLGGSLDNNIICTDEKEVICVDAVTDRLKESMCAQNAYEVTGAELKKLRETVLEQDKGDGHHSVVNKEFIGKDATFILDAIGVRAPATTRMVIADVSNEHPFIWTELMMPVMGITRVPDADAAIALAVRAEHGFRHTASMHSRNIDKLSKMARLMNVSIFIKNGPNYAGLGFGGEGYTSFTIASPTGDGMTTARTFSRPRRCVLVDRFRIV